MNRSRPHPMRPVAVLASAVAIATVSLPGAAKGPQEAVSDAQYLLYLPSKSPSVDHAAIVQSLTDIGFEVVTFHADAGEAPVDHARRVAGEARSLMARGIAPAAITVLGAGTGTPVAVLTSAVTGHRRVNVVLLGHCDPLLRVDYRFRMSGRVLGLRDAGDAGSGSCRSLWREAPRVSERRDLVVDTGLGAALFDRPRPEWLQPVADWVGGGTVDVGRIRIGALERPAAGAGYAATGAGD